MAESITGRSRHRRGIWKLVILVVIVAGLLLAVTLLPVKEYILRVLTWTETLGAWAPIIVGIFYILACVLMVPGLIITIAAGFLFGLLWGTIIVSIASTVGACAAFLVGRTLARGWVEQKVADRAKFKAIDEAVGKQGFKIVLLTRLSPIFPFNLLNYAYGLTNVKFWTYAVASWLGMLPGTVMFVYFGKAAKSLTQIAAGQSQDKLATRVFLVLGLIVAIAVVVFVTHVARKALRQAVDQTESATNPRKEADV
jgi:uncharacterized membrane protein YdjX (TVP38/TMEM64 family)